MAFKDRSGKEKTYIVIRWILQVIMGILFIIAGAPKLLLQHEMWVERFEGWGYLGNFHYVVGFLELAGGLLLFFPRFMLYSAGMLAVIMIGAMGTVLMNGEPLASPLVFFSLLVVLLYFGYSVQAFDNVIPEVPKQE